MMRLTPLATSSATIARTGSAPMISWPPVIEVWLFTRILKVMLVLVAAQ